MLCAVAPLSVRDFFVPSVDDFAVVSEVVPAIAVVLATEALLPPKEKVDDAAPVADGATDPVVPAEEDPPNEKEGVVLASVFVTLESAPADAPNEKVLAVGAAPKPPSDEVVGAAAALESAPLDAPNEKVLAVGAAPNPLPVPKAPPENGFEVGFDLESAEAAVAGGAPPKPPKVLVDVAFEAAVPSD